MSPSVAHHSTASPVRRRRALTRVLAVVATALVLLGTGLAAPASAHGSAISPASRNYGCWDRWADDFQNPAMATQDPMCWQAWQADTSAMWNWNGLYREGAAGNHQAVVPDGQLCSGGNTSAGRYNAMDTPGAWKATNVGNTFTWTMHDQAKHGADYIRIYVTKQGFDPITQRPRWSDLELLKDTGRILPGVGQPSSDPVLNGVSISTSVTAPGRSGRHIVYAIWQASHSDQSYYFCSDVVFPGGSGDPDPDPVPTPSPSSSPSPTPIPSPPGPSPSPSTPPVPGGSCSATYSMVSQWPGGFQGEVKVTAGAAAIRNWTVTLAFPDGQRITQAWNAAVTSSGGAVSASNAAWNGGIASGASTTFGFTGSWTGSNRAPTLACTSA